MERLGSLRAIAAFVIATWATGGLTLWSNASRAQDSYPARPVRVVVPSAPGSTTDTLARIVADQLVRVWAKPVIVENVPGGAMNAGAANVARAAPTA